MSEVRSQVQQLILNPRYWGSPHNVEAGMKPMPGKWCSHIRGINKSMGEWWTVKYGRSKIKEAIDEGIDPSRLVVNFLGYDCEDVDPLWAADGMRRRIDTMKEFGVSHVIAPDFSVWYDMPRIVQMHNIYKSAVCTKDLIQAGFTLIPNIRPHVSDPLLNEVGIGSWSKDIRVFLLDIQHEWPTKDGAVGYMRKAQSCFPDAQMIVYYSSKVAVRDYWAAAPTKPTLCPSYNVVRAAYIKNKARNTTN